ncbi:hypothetical protein ApDm4_1104 [Acetobacter pomorum]|nr:hypothetical protein ApDm4_1104 [Acetobacter pomorum]
MRLFPYIGTKRSYTQQGKPVFHHPVMPFYQRNNLNKAITLAFSSYIRQNTYLLGFRQVVSLSA